MTARTRSGSVYDGAAGYVDLGVAKIDHDRQRRTGCPEAVLCTGKSIAQIRQIFAGMASLEEPLLATRATPAIYQAIKAVRPEACHYPEARIVCVGRRKPRAERPPLLVVSGGTSDMPVAEEAAVTAELLGSTVDRLFDVGVAGLHRLLAHLDQVQRAGVIIVVAGMEAALASVVAGLVACPVIAVPTSVGYGSSFEGLAALLGLLNSCSPGVTVVNIDNGFGAAVAADSIFRFGEARQAHVGARTDGMVAGA